MSAFYDDLLNIEPSLARPCVGRNTWAFATTVAKEGNVAYKALANDHESVPAITRLGHVYRCASSRTQR